MSKIFGFIGCGNMGSALAVAVSKSDVATEILLNDYDKSKANELAEKIGGTVCNSQNIAAKSDFLFIGVKPQVIKNCFDEIKNYVGENTVIVSMAAGIEIADIEKMSEHKKIIRIMPNLPVSVGKGVVLAVAHNIDESEKADFRSSLKYGGVFDWTEEKYIDSAGAISGCGPAYAYIFAEALADGGVYCGLPRDKAILYSAGMLAGAAEMILQSDKHPDKLKDEVCSPGGTTIAGVKTLEDNAFRSTVMNAVISAFQRTKELK